MSATGSAPDPGDFAFVVFADDWGRHPSSCQHIFRRILPKAEVLWVNTVGLRTPRISLYDIKRSAEILSHWLKPGVKEAGNGAAPAGEAPDTAAAADGKGGRGAASQNGRQPKVARPVMLPFFHWHWADALNQKLIRRGVDAALRGFAPGKRRVLVSTLPIIPGLFREGPWARKVYYCVDDFTTWPGVSGDTMRRLEERTLPHCDVMIATSSGLLETRGPKVPRAHLLTHGVDGAHFRRALDAAPHPSLAGLPRPVLGLFGSFDARVDGDILRELARRHAGGTVVVMGPVDRDLSEFASCPNIRFLGPVPYAELPERIAALDVLVLPYVVDASTDKINPLKLKEYLATGKPVVSSPLPEARRLSDFCLVASKEEFPVAVEQALREAAVRGRSPSKALEDFLASESWEGKAERFCAWALEGL
jgi:glycosyltransferase involved in cell wall biosynthesis